MGYFFPFGRLIFYVCFAILFIHVRHFYNILQKRLQRFISVKCGLNLVRIEYGICTSYMYHNNNYYYYSSLPFVCIDERNHFFFFFRFNFVFPFIFGFKKKKKRLIPFFSICRAFYQKFPRWLIWWLMVIMCKSCHMANKRDVQIDPSSRECGNSSKKYTSH